MAQLTLPPLPRQTDYQEVQIAAGTTQRPAWGGPLLPLARTGDRWAFDVSIPAMEAATCGTKVKLILAKGKINTVIMAIREPGSPVRDYGSPRVALGGQQGTSLNVAGLTPGVVIPDGKWMNLVIGGQHFLYLVDGEATADGNGTAILKLWPMIRRSAPLNAPVRLADPVIEGFVTIEGGVSIKDFAHVGSAAVNFRIEEQE